MFKNFTEFNALADKLFKDETFNLVANAFQSFKAMLSALRTEAYDYATWYNKIMRDKYEDGAPVDVTDLPYLSVPRSQLAVMRGRISKVREAVNYAANAITNVALGWKTGLQSLFTSTVDSISSDIAISATLPDPILSALKRIQYCIGDLVVTFQDGADSVIVNGVSTSVSPMVRGTFTIIKRDEASSARLIAGSYGINSNEGSVHSTRAVPGELIRSMLRAPLVVARSIADLEWSSRAPVGILIANRQFFNKRLIIWAEANITIDTDSRMKLRFMDCTLHARLVASDEVKPTIASSLYGYLSEDYAEAMSYSAPNISGMLSYGYDDSNPSALEYWDGSAWVAADRGAVITAIDQAVAVDDTFYGSFADVTEATTQTAISDMFYTSEEWESLLSSLTEA